MTSSSRAEAFSYDTGEWASGLPAAPLSDKSCGCRGVSSDSVFSCNPDVHSLGDLLPRFNFRHRVRSGRIWAALSVVAVFMLGTSGSALAVSGSSSSGKSYNRMLWTALRKKAAYLPG